MSGLTPLMVEQYIDRLRSWFFDQAGIDIKKVRKGEVTEADMEVLRSKGKIRERVRAGLLNMMRSRQKKGLGSYDVDNHILLNNLAFDRLYKELQVDVAKGVGNHPLQTYLPREETWRSRSGRIFVREVLRYPKGHKWAGRFMKRS